MKKRFLLLLLALCLMGCSSGGKTDGDTTLTETDNQEIKKEEPMETVFSAKAWGTVWQYRATFLNGSVLFLHCHEGGRWRAVSGGAVCRKYRSGCDHR